MRGVFKIAISAKSGCGNTTVSALVAKKLNCRFINFTFRNLAEEHNISLSEVMALAKTDDKWDREVDRRQIELANLSGNCVLGSRLAIWLLKDADLKVYLDAGIDVRSSRIMQREGGVLEEIIAFTSARDNCDSERYLKLYGINNNDFSFADLIVDVKNLAPEDIAEKIIAALDKKRMKV